MNIMKRTEKDDAVSPVVGVMLMLVVTIVIAAVVAAFATGIATETQAPSMTSIDLVDVTMANPSGVNYAPYSMTFKHMGGNALDINYLTLAITYNVATYRMPFSAASPSLQDWTVGKTIKLSASDESYGLSQQDMRGFGNYYDWAILDGSGNVISKGTKSTKYVAPAEQIVSIIADKFEINSGESVTFTITTSGIEDGTELTLDKWDNKVTFATPTGTVSGNAATITTEITATENVEKFWYGVKMTSNPSVSGMDGANTIKITVP